MWTFLYCWSPWICNQIYANCLLNALCKSILQWEGFHIFLQVHTEFSKSPKLTLKQHLKKDPKIQNNKIRSHTLKLYWCNLRLLKFIFAFLGSFLLNYAHFEALKNNYLLCLSRLRFFYESKLEVKCSTLQLQDQRKSMSSS